MLGDLRKRLQPVGRLDVLDAVGERALAYYAAQDAGTLDASALARRAKALHLIGEIAEQRGQPAEARQRFAEAARSTAELLARAPSDPQRVFDHAQSEFWVAEAARRSGRPGEALAGFERYRVLASRLIELEPGKAEWQLEQAFAEQNLGVLAYEQAKANEAARTGLSNNLGWIARAHEDLGQLQQSLEVHDAKIRLLQSHAGVDRESQFQIANAHTDSARLQLALGRFAQSHADAVAATRLLGALVEVDASNEEWRSALASAQVSSAEALLARGDVQSAARALDVATRWIGPMPADASGLDARNLDLRARWLIARARQLGASAAAAEAMGLLLDAALAREAQLQVLRSPRRRTLATLALALGDALVAHGEVQAARIRWLQAQRALGDPSGEPQSTTVLAHLDQRLGQARAAAQLADSLLAGPCRHPLVFDLFARLGRSPPS